MSGFYGFRPSNHRRLPPLKPRQHLLHQQQQHLQEQNQHQQQPQQHAYFTESASLGRASATFQHNNNHNNSSSNAMNGYRHRFGGAGNPSPSPSSAHHLNTQGDKDHPASAANGIPPRYYLTMAGTASQVGSVVTTPRISRRRSSPRTRSNAASQQKGSVRTLHRSAVPSRYDLSVTGHSPASQPASSGSAPPPVSLLCSASAVQVGLDSHDQTDRNLSSDVSPAVVSQYLRQNPDFLDNYVTTHVNTDVIETWLSRKLANQRTTRNSTARPKDSLKNGDQTPDKQVALSRWKSKIQVTKGRVLEELAKDFHHTNGKLLVLSELADCVSAAISADAHTLYSCSAETQEMTHISRSDSGNIVFGGSESIEHGTSMAASVAFSKEPKRLKDVFQEKGHPDGLTVNNRQAHCVLGLPIMDNKDQCLGVVEFYRHSKDSHFTDEEEEVALLLLQWYDMLLDNVETHSSVIRQRTLGDFLLEVTKSVFQDIVSMDVVIMKIMNFAKALVNADRASLFLLDTRSNELYARIFDDGYSLEEHSSPTVKALLEGRSSRPSGVHEDSSGGGGGNGEYDGDGSRGEEKAREEVEERKRPEWSQQDIRFSMDKGVAGYVATTGKVLNIKDAYKDSRFNREVDIRTGYRTKSILCMPIFIRGQVIGVVQMVNKLKGHFTKEDEDAFATFAIYCGLALHHAKLYEKIRRSEQKYKVALDVLSYHSQATPEEVLALQQRNIPSRIPSITKYNFSPWAVGNDDKPLYVLFMFNELFKNLNYDMDDLIRFTLTVRKNYRNVPYHNWIHAFSVAHSMFTVIQTTTHQLTPVESISLFVSCLCHDLDHRGKTNQFMVQSASPLAAIYSTSTMEHHHFNQTVTILQNDGHNIFKYLSSDEYKKVLSDIKKSILATDLVVFFKNKAILHDILKKDTFSWDIVHHRNTLRAVMMTACDLCAMYKPWPVQQELVYIIMEEFWQQGDEEKQKGLVPMQMMDRDKKDDLPNLEVGFIETICVPCYELMATVMPHSKPMLEGARENLKKWKKLANELKKFQGTQV